MGQTASNPVELSVSSAVDCLDITSGNLDNSKIENKQMKPLINLPEENDAVNNLNFNYQSKVVTDNPLDTIDEVDEMTDISLKDCGDSSEFSKDKTLGKSLVSVHDSTYGSLPALNKKLNHTVNFPLTNEVPHANHDAGHTVDAGTQAKSSTKDVATSISYLNEKSFNITYNCERTESVLAVPIADSSEENIIIKTIEVDYTDIDDTIDRTVDSKTCMLSQSCSSPGNSIMDKAKFFSLKELNIINPKKTSSSDDEENKTEHKRRNSCVDFTDIIQEENSDATAQSKSSGKKKRKTKKIRFCCF